MSTLLGQFQMKMSSVHAISSYLIKKTIPICALSSTSTTKPSLILQTFNSLSLSKVNPAHDSLSFLYASAQMNCNGPNELPAKSPPEVPTAPPFHKPGIPPEMPRRPNVPDFDAIPPEKPADPPPISPGPEFPGPTNPSQPKPEGPQPPIPSPPREPEVFPPHGPDVIPPQPPEPGEGVPPPKPEIDPPHGPDFIPPKPPEPGFPHPTQPDIPPPITM